MSLSAAMPTCAFMPKYHSLPFFVEDISGSRLPASSLVEDGASMMVASNRVPERSVIPLSTMCPFTSMKIASVGPCCSRRWRKFRIVVSSGIRHCDFYLPFFCSGRSLHRPCAPLRSQSCTKESLRRVASESTNG